MAKAHTKVRRLLEKNTQRALAERAQVSQTTICHVASGRTTPYLVTRKKFKKLGVELEDWT